MSAALRARLRRAAEAQLRKRSPLGRMVESFWRHRLTPAGRAVLGLFFVSALLAATVTLAFPLYQYAAFLLALMVVSRAAGWLFAGRLEAVRRLPERCPAGARLEVEAEVRNRGRLPAYDIAVAERAPPRGLEGEREAAYLEHLPPGGTGRVTYGLHAKKRGAYTLPGALAMSAFPFGLYHEARLVDGPHRLLVHPRFTPLARLDLPAGRRYQPGGMQLMSHIGDSEEFVGNREYRPGDRRRDIDHRAWARLGTPVVREYRQEYLTRVALLLDTHVPPGDRAAERAFEAALSLAAAVGDALGRQEVVIDLFAAGPDLYHLQAGRSLAYLEHVLDILACLEPCPRSPFATLAPALTEETGRFSTAVAVFLDWDEERDAFVRLLEDRGLALKAIVVRDGPPTFDPRTARTTGGAVRVATPTEVEAGLGAF